MYFAHVVWKLACKPNPTERSHSGPDRGQSKAGPQASCPQNLVRAHQMLRPRAQMALKVFWSSGRPQLCFSRFWPSENVARIRRVYFAYSRTKSVHTRNIASNANGKCVFCFDCAKWSHYFIHRGALAARTKFHDVSTNEKQSLV